jgi:opacity protein-like surface antigen
MRTSTRASASDPGGGLTALLAESANKFNPRWGAGLEYRLTSAAAARIEYENVRKIGDDAKFGTADVILWTIGANYRF